MVYDSCYIINKVNLLHDETNDESNKEPGGSIKTPEFTRSSKGKDNFYFYLLIVMGPPLNNR